VSVEAISWALTLDPIPAGRGGQPSTACKFVLVRLAKMRNIHRLPSAEAAGKRACLACRPTEFRGRLAGVCLSCCAAPSA
jgi:hypothetical protein